MTSVVTSPGLRWADLTSNDPRGLCLVTREPGLVPAFYNEAGAGGGQPGLDTLPVLERRTEVTLPHPLYAVLDVRKLAYLRLCK